MRKNFKKNITIVLVVLFFSLGFFNQALAASCENVTILGGEITICDNSLIGFTVLLVVVAKFILGISGALALGMFVWGGAQMLFYAGNSSEAKKGFDILKNAVVGLVIVFSAYLFITFLVQGLTGTIDSKNADANKPDVHMR